MQVVQGHDNLTGKEDGCGVVKAMGSAQVREEFATSYVLQQHVQESVVMVSPHPVRRTLAISLASSYNIVHTLTIMAERMPLQLVQAICSNSHIDDEGMGYGG